MSTYISVNVVSQSLILMTQMVKHKCYSTEDIHQLQLPYGVDKEIAYSFAQQCGWLSEVAGHIKLTETGYRINEGFDGVFISPELWKLILHEYICICQPVWARRIPYGRKEAYLIMNEEEQRCFDEAGLVQNYEKDVVDWWDSIAEEERVYRDFEHTEIGRSGERLTIKYEEWRTGVIPNWSSVESNLAGYDILSQKSKNDIERILIEVKSTFQTVEEAKLYLTRHEWDIAQMGNNQMRYYFYLWVIQPPANRLAIVSVADMSKYVPRDSEGGRWDSAVIPYHVFSDRFVLIDN